MQKDDKGVWSVTTAPLAPDYYGYSFVVDGVRALDPFNHGSVPNLISPGNFVHVSGPPTLPWEVADVPRGEVHHHFYKSAVAGDQRDYYVYTPPGWATPICASRISQSSATRCSPRSSQPSSASTGSRKIAMREPSRDCRWAARSRCEPG
jgi:hypothetical protein